MQAGVGRLRWASIAVLLCLLSTVLLFVARPADAAVFTPSIFGSKEIRATSLKMFPKWRGAMDRFAKELQSCPPALCNTKAWAKLVGQLKGQDIKTQLKIVNTTLNRSPYILDIVNWGVADYWETPFEFLRRNGDCEDFAIAKFYALRDAGVSTDIMRIVVLTDLNLGIGHAVLVVYVDGAPLVLDNQIKQVVPAASIKHYKPIYSVNDKGWWLHRPA